MDIIGATFEWDALYKYIIRGSVDDVWHSELLVFFLGFVYRP
jgi:hypothetical protein